LIPFDVQIKAAVLCHQFANLGPDFDPVFGQDALRPLDFALALIARCVSSARLRIVMDAIVSPPEA
jgi:hypothetical protein